MPYRKKLIEVALPLEAINAAARQEKGPFTKNHPRALHVWWARRPLTASRAVLFASLVDDPSSNPQTFPTEEDQRVERERLFRILEALVKWENSNDGNTLNVARTEIKKSMKSDPPPILDPFCGGGSIPLEAQRLGLETYASDLNPVAVLITKALAEIPPRFEGCAPVNGESRQRVGHGTGWIRAFGLAEDVRYYGKWIVREAEKRIGHLYPKVKLPREHGVGEAQATAWIWARTVTCPNPACGAEMPLVRSFWLSTKKGQKAWVEPVVDKANKSVVFLVRQGEGTASEGTVSRRGARCLVCETAVQFRYIREESRAGRMSARLMTIVGHLNRRRLFLSPDPEHELIAAQARPSWSPDGEIADNPGHMNVYRYGLTTFGQLFTPRQLVALTTLSDLVAEARDQVLQDAVGAGLSEDGVMLNEGGKGAASYADAVAVYLGLAISRFTDFSNSICSWDAGNTNLRQLFARQAIPMAWDFAETNPMKGVVDVNAAFQWAASALEAVPATGIARIRQLDASQTLNGTESALVCTDPPYYDNIGYADLADFFYVWLRRSLASFFPDIFSTLLSPKTQELVATAYRFADKTAAKRFFEEGLKRSFDLIRRIQDPDYPMTLYYGFKQSETDFESGEQASTGWETMLAALLGAGFAVTGTWPMRTEQQQRSVASGANALASSVVMVCRPRDESAPLATRKEFVVALRAELPGALRNLQQGSIAPVDLAQASIGPGMAVFSKFKKVIEADGSPMSVRTALTIINQVLDEVLAQHESEYDDATRWAVAWFEQNGMNEAVFGDAETLAKAKNTSVAGMEQDGILLGRKGKVRLLARDELSESWDPATDQRLTVWEVTQNLVRALERQGEMGAGELLRKVGSLGEVAKDLAYRLFTISDRRGWTFEALAYNALVAAWPEIVKLAAREPEGQGALEV